MSLHTEYIKIENIEVKFSIHFNRNKINYFTYEKIDIGYRVSATPVKRTQDKNITIEESVAFSGFADTLLIAERQSKKRLEEAIKILNDRKEKYINWFKEKYNLKT